MNSSKKIDFIQRNYFLQLLIFILQLCLILYQIFFDSYCFLYTYLKEYKIWLIWVIKLSLDTVFYIIIFGLCLFELLYFYKIYYKNF